MAKETITRLIDDLDGVRADETVQFGLDSQDYEVDLSSANAARLRAALAPYTKVAHRLRHLASANRIPDGGRRAVRTGGGSSTDRTIRLAIKAWANNWYPGLCADRGRLPRTVEAAYHNGQDQTALDAYAQARGHTKQQAVPKVVKQEPITSAHKQTAAKRPTASAVAPIDFSDPTGPASPEEPKRTAKPGNRGGTRNRTTKTA